MDSTEGNTLWDPEVLADFGDVLKRYKLQALAGKTGYNEYDIVREFCSIAATKAHYVASHGSDTTKFEDWDLEVKLWNLVESLLSYRYSEKEAEIDVYPFNSDVVFQEQFLRNDPQLYEIWIIINWIQKNSEEVERPASLASSKWLNTQLSNKLEAMDSDAPIRLNTPIDPKDQEQDNVFYKYIFELLLSGNVKEATRECEVTNNWTLRMILAGIDSYADPVIDKQVDEDEMETQIQRVETHGIKKKALWRRSVYLLSKNEKLPPYERAIYGFLAGDLSPLEVSTSWDSDLLIYLNHIFNSEIENKLLDAGKISKEDLIMNFPRNDDLSVQKVLNALATQRKEESEHPLRVLVASVISNNIPAIIHNSLSLVGNIMLGKQPSNVLIDEPYLLRVVTHMAIFVSIIDPSIIDAEDRSKLITTYVLMLRLYGEYELIPLYVSFLPEHEAKNAYPTLLIDLYEPEARAKQLELSRLYELPLENILKNTVERVFTVTEQSYQLNTGAVVLRDIDDMDTQLIRGVEWFVEARMFSDAIHATVYLFRRFFLTGRARAAQELASRNPVMKLLKHYDVESMGLLVEQQVTDLEKEELIQYDHLITALNAVDEWKSSGLPKQTYAFLDTTTKITTTIKETIDTLFYDLSQTDYEKERIHEMRSLYIPLLIIELHNIYVAGSSQNSDLLSQALQLTNMVASESTKFYQLFQHCDRLKEYLNLVAQCAAMAAGESF